MCTTNVILIIYHKQNQPTYFRDRSIAFPSAAGTRSEVFRLRDLDGKFLCSLDTTWEPLSKRTGDLHGGWCRSGRLVKLGEVLRVLGRILFTKTNLKRFV